MITLPLKLITAVGFKSFTLDPQRKLKVKLSTGESQEAETNCKRKTSAWWGSPGLEVPIFE